MSIRPSTLAATVAAMSTQPVVVLYVADEIDGCATGDSPGPPSRSSMARVIGSTS